MGAEDMSVVLPGEGERPEERYHQPQDGASYDLIIIGGGPAGMTAAVYAARKRLSTALLSMDLGGQILVTSDVENYLGYHYISGRELVDKFETQVKQYPIDMGLGEEVVRVAPLDGGFSVETKGGNKYQGKVIIIATGKRYRPLNVPGEKELVGHGVSYCATCDGPLFKGKNVAVVGGGNSAFTAVADLLPIANSIYVVNIAAAWQADAILLERADKSDKVETFLEHQVTGIQGEARVTGITIQPLKEGAEKTLEVEGVFVEIGLLPNSEFLKGVVELNSFNEVVIDCDCHTSVIGIFAAGDVTMVPEKQIIVAAGEGSKAALTAYDYLLRSGLRLGSASK